MWEVKIPFRVSAQIAKLYNGRSLWIPPGDPRIETMLRGGVHTYI
jgi:hypothetical protein